MLFYFKNVEHSAKTDSRGLLHQLHEIGGLRSGPLPLHQPAEAVRHADDAASQ